MISLSLLVIALLGLDVMQLSALRQAQSLYYQQIAEQQLKVVSEMLESVKEGDTANVVAWWNKQNEKVLPRGRGEVSGVYPNYAIKIFWGKRK